MKIYYKERKKKTEIKYVCFEKTDARERFVILSLDPPRGGTCLSFLYDLSLVIRLFLALR